jgi:hypothetical protein
MFSLSFDHAILITQITAYWDILNTGGILAALLNFACAGLIVFVFKHMGDDKDDNPDG